MKDIPYECVEWKHIHKQGRTTGDGKLQKKLRKLIEWASSIDWDKKIHSIYNTIKREDSFHLSDKKGVKMGWQKYIYFKVDRVKINGEKEMNNIY